MTTIGTFRFGLDDEEKFARYQESLVREAAETFEGLDFHVHVSDAVDLFLDTVFSYSSLGDIEPGDLVNLLYDAFSQAEHGEDA